MISKKKDLSFISLIFISILIACNQQGNTSAPAAIDSKGRGTLFIIGGGDHDDTLMQR
jgi:hypothetical protein